MTALALTTPRSVAGGLTLAAIAGVALGAPTPLRLPLVLLFVALAPGLGLTRFLPDLSVGEIAAMIVGFSLSAVVVISQALVLVDRWSGAGTMIALAALTLALVVVPDHRSADLPVAPGGLQLAPRPDSPAFPPVSSADWRRVHLGDTTPLDPSSVRAVFDIAWFFLGDVQDAIEVTTATFRVALSRLHHLPDPAYHLAFLAAIAANEADRHLEERADRPTWSALARPTGGDDTARAVVDALAPLPPEHRLAVLLRRRYGIPTEMIGPALRIRSSRLERILAVADSRLAENGLLPRQAPAKAQPPAPRSLPTSLSPYPARDLRPSRLGYTWLASGFPVLAHRAERNNKIATALALGIFATLLVIALVI